MSDRVSDPLCPCVCQRMSARLHAFDSRAQGCYLGRARSRPTPPRSSDYRSLDQTRAHIFLNPAATSDPSSCNAVYSQNIPEDTDAADGRALSADRQPASSRRVTEVSNARASCTRIWRRCPCLRTREHKTHKSPAARAHEGTVAQARLHDVGPMCICADSSRQLRSPRWQGEGRPLSPSTPLVCAARMGLRCTCCMHPP